jgi:hypothetical protein
LFRFFRKVRSGGGSKDVKVVKKKKKEPIAGGD